MRSFLCTSGIRGPIRPDCAAHNMPVHLHHVETLDAAKSLPCVFNNFAVFYSGKFQTVNLLTADALARILGNNTQRGCKK